MNTKDNGKDDFLKAIKDNSKASFMHEDIEKPKESFSYEQKNSSLLFAEGLKKTKIKNETVSARIPENLLRILKAEAVIQGSSLSDIVTAILHEFVTKKMNSKSENSLNQ